MSLEKYILALIITIAIFLICREIVCWYWKINKRISLLEENNQLLKSHIKIEQERIQTKI